MHQNDYGAPPDRPAGFLMRKRKEGEVGREGEEGQWEGRRERKGEGPSPSRRNS